MATKRKVLITGTMTANASTMFSNRTDFEPMVKKAFQADGWEIVSVKLVGGWLSYYETSVAIEVNVFDTFSLDTIRQAATNVLSNVYHDDTGWLGYDPTYPIFTNVYITAAEANPQQIQQAFDYDNSLDEIADQAANFAKKQTESYLLPLVAIGILIFVLKD